MNQYTSSGQLLYDRVRSVATDAAGNFVVTWYGAGSGGVGDDVYYRLFNADGAPLTGDLRANGFTTGNQSNPSVAMRDDGQFVIVWNDNTQEGTSMGVYGRRFNANGQPAGGEFHVNTYTANEQSTPSVAVNHASGDFVVTWRSMEQDGSGSGIYAQSFDAAGARLGGEFLVNTTVANHQSYPTVDINAQNLMVFTWAGIAETGSREVYARRMFLDGTAMDPQEFMVNVNQANDQTKPVVAMNDQGRFAIVYETLDTDPNVIGRVFAGDTIGGPEFGLAAVTTNSQFHPWVDMDSTGAFVASWESIVSDGNNTWGVVARRFAPDGTPIGNDIRANTYTTDVQAWPSVAVQPGGGFVVTWTSAGQDGSSYGAYAQRFAPDGTADGELFRVNTTLASDQIAQRPMSVASDRDGNFVVAWVAINQPGGSGQDVYAQMYDSAGNRRGGEFRVNTTLSGDQNYPAVAMNEGGNFVIVWQSFSDTNIYAQRFDATGQRMGLEFRVNTQIVNVQQLPAVAMDNDGGFLIAWSSNHRSANDQDIYARRYNSSGQPTGASEFAVNATTTLDQISPAVAMDDTGRAVITWMSNATTSAHDIYARRLTESGDLLGGEFQVNTTTAGLQVAPTAAMDDSGRFVIAWCNQDVSPRIGAQRFDEGGNRIGGEVLINTTLGAVSAPVIAMDETGDHVIAWMLNPGTGGIRMQRYAADGSAQGIETRVNPLYVGVNYTVPSVAMDGDGDFVVIWSASGTGAAGTPNLGFDVYGQRYNWDFAPVANAGSGYTTEERGSIVLSAAGTFDLDQDPGTLTYQWDLDGDGIFGETGSLAGRGNETGMAPVFTATSLDGPTVYTVRLRVTDQGGLVSTAQAPITIANAAPSILSLGLPSSTSEGYAIGGTASTSDTDPVVAYLWTVTRNGELYASSSAQRIGFVPDDNGLFEVKLVVTDDEGASREQTQTVTVNNSTPTIHTLPASVGTIVEGQTVSFDTWYNERGWNDSQTVTINWGDGQEDTFALAAVRNHNLLLASSDPWEFTGADGVTHYYYVTNWGTAMSWEQAEAQAVLMGGHLATINSQGENDSIAKLIRDKFNGSNMHAWIGLSDREQEGVFRWASGELLADTGYQNWGSGQPDNWATNGGEDFVYMNHTSTGQWNDGSLAGMPGVSVTAGIIELTAPLALPVPSFHATHTYANDAANQADTFTITVTLTDKDGGSVQRATTATVGNVDPVLTSLTTTGAAVGNVGAGNALNLSGAFTDAGVNDLHIVMVDWGDGSPMEPVSVNDGLGSGTFSGNHNYAAGGIYQITLQLSDGDGGFDQGAAQSFITGVGVRPMPQTPSAPAHAQLQVIGTTGDDVVTMNQQGDGSYLVHAAFLPGGQAVIPANSDIESILVAAGDGNDHVQISSGVRTPAILFGGSGADLLNGGNGQNAIFGDDGDDLLLGGGDKDLLMGGNGADRIVGNGGGDQLIAARDDRFILGRYVEVEEFLFSSRLFTMTQDTHDDTEVDVLTGSSGEDHFFASLDEFVGDIITDKAEILNALV